MKRGALGALLVLVSCGPTADPASRDGQGGRSAAESRVGVSEARAVAYEVDPSLARGGPPGDHFSDELPLAWRSEGFEQRWTATDFRTLLVTDRVRDATGAWQSTTHQRSASFTFLHVEPARLDHFDLLGVTRERDLMVARWTLVPQVPGEEAAADSALSPPRKEFQERVLYRGLRGHAPLAVQGDPRLRFVLFAARDEAGVVSVYRLDSTTDGSQPVPLTSSLAIPELAEVRSAQKFDHALLGRVYVFGTSFEDRHRIVFVDADDDGVFERPPLVGDDAFFAEQGLARYEDWRSLTH